MSFGCPEFGDDDPRSAVDPRDMGWEPLPSDLAEWMGMDDDYLRPEAAAGYDVPRLLPVR